MLNVHDSTIRKYYNVRELCQTYRYISDIFIATQNFIFLNIITSSISSFNCFEAFLNKTDYRCLKKVLAVLYHLEDFVKK